MRRYGHLDTSHLSMVLHDPLPYYEGMKAIYRARFNEQRKGAVAFVTGTLGKPDQHWVGGSQNRKFRVWYRDPLYVLAHNEAGISVEVMSGTEPDVALAAFDTLIMELTMQSPKERAEELITKYRDYSRNGIFVKPDMNQEECYAALEELLRFVIFSAHRLTSTLDLSGVEWEGDPEEPGYVHGSCYFNDVHMFIHAFRLDDDHLTEWAPHPDLPEVRQEQLQHCIEIDPECNFDSLELPGFEGRYCLFVQPLSQ